MHSSTEPAGTASDVCCDKARIGDGLKFLDWQSCEYRVLSCCLGMARPLAALDIDCPMSGLSDQPADLATTSLDTLSSLLKLRLPTLHCPAPDWLHAGSSAPRPTPSQRGALVLRAHVPCYARSHPSRIEWSNRFTACRWNHSSELGAPNVLFVGCAEALETREQS